jgi:hypothetical protein
VRVSHQLQQRTHHLQINPYSFGSGYTTSGKKLQPETKIWDVVTGNSYIDWPEHIDSPAQACEKWGYDHEMTIGTERFSLVIYQWPQRAKEEQEHSSNEWRYLLLLNMKGGFELIGARDLKSMLLALKSLELLIHLKERPSNAAFSLESH